MGEDGLYGLDVSRNAPPERVGFTVSLRGIRSIFLK